MVTQLGVEDSTHQQLQASLSIWANNGRDGQPLVELCIFDADPSVNGMSCLKRVALSIPDRETGPLVASNGETLFVDLMGADVLDFFVSSGPKPLGDCF